jgi:hypothetical protein
MTPPAGWDKTSRHYGVQFRAGRGEAHMTASTTRIVAIRLVSCALAVLSTIAAGATVSVTKGGTGAGAVVASTGAIQCGAVCSDAYADGTALTLTASPAAGSQFTGWLGPCTGAGTCQFIVAGNATAIATFAPASLGIPPTLDVDANGAVDALTDGLIAIRYLFGLSGSALINGALGPNAQRADSAQILDYLNDIRPLLDIDGNGQCDALTDGLLLLRYLFGLRGSSLIVGVIGSGAIRTTSPPIESLLGTETALGSQLPPDPASVAPPLDPGVATTTDSATRFLYSGTRPIQTGVDPAALDAKRVAVLRGRVLDTTGAAVSGVTINILGHSEFGQTLSRPDGMFDLVVNGGGPLTVHYQKSGFPAAQRQVDVRWQDFTIVPDVMLVAYDPNGNAVSLCAGSPSCTQPPMQIVRGSRITDSNGTRQAVLLIPSGTGASATLPDASVVPLGTLTIRATEFTVGPNGPLAMPADLPPTSAYTYQVEFSVDEAEALGATRVDFSQPLISYTENFISIPVGWIVPSGDYSRQSGSWIPAPDGRVIQITGVTGGLAVLDTVGTNGLAPLTIGDDELRQLALLYPVGQQLWRVPIRYFFAIK